jgi:hypothetical protein
VAEPPAKAHYEKSRYWSHLRIHGYANQLRELYELGAERVLEIGVADGFMSTVVPTFTRHSLVSCDLDRRLRPTVSASVLALPFRTDAFDVVLCCQVLEHLPFAELPGAIGELRRVARRAVFVSVPDVRQYVAARVRLPKLGWRGVAWSFERPSLGPYVYDGEHHWEIGYRGTHFSDVRRAILASGVTIRRWYRIPELPYHCCFLLDPAKTVPAHARGEDGQRGRA